jgi:hypothetical protein
MTQKQFAKYLERDGHCLHCGQEQDLVPQHRINRGSGGKNNKADKPSNIIVFCSLANSEIEANYKWQSLAKIYNWKLSQWDDPLQKPVYDFVYETWYQLDDKFQRIVIDNSESGPPK